PQGLCRLAASLLTPAGEEMLGYPSVFRAATFRASQSCFEAFLPPDSVASPRDSIPTCLVPTTTKRPRQPGRRRVCSAGGARS
ncbi:hypothetical protein D0N87_34290, partial [Pseudomonas sp. ATCC 13867]